MKTMLLLVICGLDLAVLPTSAAPFVAVTQGEEWDLAATYDSNDLIQGLIATELPGDLGWYPAVIEEEDKLPAFTDGAGVRSTGLTGLLRDYPGAGTPAKRIRYELRAPADITEVRVFTGNDGRDGRVFHTYTVRFSTDGAQTFSAPIYVQSHVSGTVNSSAGSNWRVVLSQLSDTTGNVATRVTHTDFDFYAVDNTGGEMRDPYDGVNPFTAVDDTLAAAFVSPLVWEIDIIGQYSAPILSVTRVGNNIGISWVGLTNGAVLQGRTNLTTSAWLDISPQPPIISSGNTNTAQVSIGYGQKYFRVKY